MDVDVDEFERSGLISGEFLAIVRRGVGVVGKGWLLRPLTEVFFLIERGSIVEPEEVNDATVAVGGRGVRSPRRSRLDLGEFWRVHGIPEVTGRELERLYSAESGSERSSSDDMDATDDELRGGGSGEGDRGPLGLFTDCRESGR